MIVLMFYLPHIDNKKIPNLKFGTEFNVISIFRDFFPNTDIHQLYLSLYNIKQNY